MSLVLTMMGSTATISRKTISQASATGAKVATWANAYTGVRCAIQANNSYESRIAQRETGLAQFTGFFPYGTDILNTDRVVPDDGQHAGKTLTVKGTAIDHAGRQDYIAVPLEEVKGGGTL